jgi:hypothetical protein
VPDANIMSRLITILIVLFGCLFSLSAQRRLRTPASPLTPPKLLLDASFQDATGDQVLMSEEQGIVKAKITNQGGAARNVVVRLRPLVPVEGIVIDSAATVESLPPGRTENLSFIIWATDDVQSGTAALIVEAEDDTKLGITSAGVDVVLRETQGPDLVVERVRVNGRTLGNSGVGAKAGAKNVIDLEVKNDGKRKARGVSVTPTLEAPFAVLSPAGAADVGELVPGEKRGVNFSIAVSDQSKARSLLLRVRISERRRKYSAVREVRIPISKF